MNLNHICIDIAGEPGPQPRVRGRLTGKGKGAFVHMYTPTTTGKKGNKKPMKASVWKKNIIDEMDKLKAENRRPAEPWQGPIRIFARMFLKRPQYLTKKSSPDGPIPKNTKPDGDNYEKALFDALVDAGVMKDDGQVYCCLWVKLWAAKGYQPGTQLDIYHDVDLGGAMKALEQINHAARGMTQAAAKGGE